MSAVTYCLANALVDDEHHNSCQSGSSVRTISENRFVYSMEIRPNSNVWLIRVSKRYIVAVLVWLMAAALVYMVIINFKLFFHKLKNKRMLTYPLFVAGLIGFGSFTNSLTGLKKFNHWIMP